MTPFVPTLSTQDLDTLLSRCYSDLAQIRDAFEYDSLDNIDLWESGSDDENHIAFVKAKHDKDMEAFRRVRELILGMHFDL